MFAQDDFVNIYLDDAVWHEKVCSGRFRKGFIWTIQGSIGRFAPDDFVKVFIWTIRVGMWRCAPDDVVKVVSGQSLAACGGVPVDFVKLLSRRPG